MPCHLCKKLEYIRAISINKWYLFKQTISFKFFKCSCLVNTLPHFCLRLHNAVKSLGGLIDSYWQYPLYFSLFQFVDLLKRLLKYVDILNEQLSCEAKILYFFLETWRWVVTGHNYVLKIWSECSVFLLLPV